MVKDRQNWNSYHDMTLNNPTCRVMLVMNKVSTKRMERNTKLIAAVGATRLVLSLQPGRWSKRNYKRRAYL